MDLNLFYDTYTKNYENSHMLDESVLEYTDYESWKNAFASRSNGIRNIYKENTTIISDLIEYLENDPSIYADELFDLLNDLYFGAYDDFFIMKTIIDKLLPYYESKNDIEKLVFLHAVFAFENFEFFGRVSGNEKNAESLATPYLKVISYEQYYDKIENRDIRNRISAAYSNLIAPIAQYHEETRKNIFEIYENAYKLYNNHIAPMGDRTEAEYCRLIDADMLFLEEHLDELNENEIKKFEEIVEKLKNDESFDDEEGNLFRAIQSLSIYKKEKDVDTVINEYISYIDNLSNPDYENLDENTNLLYILNFYNCAETIFTLIDKFKITPEKSKEYANKFLKTVTNVLTSIPYSFQTAMCNNLCSEWFHVAEQYIDSFEDKKNLLFDMILCRQPNTYIHSLMVQKIANEISKEIIKTKPEMLVGILNTTNEDEVANKKEEILKYISDCSMMHDIGKCAIAEVINKQTRKLSDDEFGIIKLHPEKALHIINDDPAFANYTDVMLGHHRTYDGKRGYPMNFDNVNSKVRIIIDIITICDSVDAATDIYGRNYTEGKTFDTVFSELKQFSGERYNGEIVDLIENSKELYSLLLDLTSEKRKVIYFEAYERILNLH